MDFERLYKKSEKKVNQKEDFLTEVIAFMGNISPEFRKTYIKDFLGFKNIKNYNYYTFETQTREEDEAISIADLIIRKRKDVFAVCEHKIDSDINGKQLINYRKKYKECEELFLVKPECSVLRKLSKKERQYWKELHWEDLFESMKESFFPEFWKYGNYNEYLMKENGLKNSTERKIIYYFLDYLFFEGLFFLDMDYYREEYKSFSNLMQNAKDGVARYFDYLKLLRKVKKSSRGGSKIKDLVDNWRVYIKYKNDYIGFYGDYEEIDSKFFMLKWEGVESKSFNFNEIKDLCSKEFKHIKFSSIKAFNRQFEEVADYLQDMSSLMFEIVKSLSSQLEMKPEEFKLNAEDETGEMVYDFEYKKKAYQISFTEKSFRLYFEKGSKNPTGSKVYEEDKDWRYFEKDVTDMKFNKDNFLKIKKWFNRNFKKVL